MTAVSERAQELAERYEAANEAFIAYVESLTLDQWLTMVLEEERTVAALAHHVAWAYAFEIDAFKEIARGVEPTPVTAEQLADVNAINAAEYIEIPQEQVVALLRQNGAAAAAFVRGLDNVALTRSGRYLAYIPSMTVDNWIRRVLIGHIEMHTRSVRRALGQEG
jgi:hypothetical protein